MLIWRKAAALIKRYGACTLVTVIEARGSVPREAGTRMIVAPDGSFHGTIGGGTLEWQAIAAAQANVATGMTPVRRDYPLGPKLGQCCGGHVALAFQRFESLADAEAWAGLEEAGGVTLFFADGRAQIEPEGTTGLRPDGSLVQAFSDDRTTLVLFGAGHVGRALVLALAPLPFRVQWIDQRDEAFPTHVPAGAECISVQKPDGWCAQGFAEAGKGCFVLIMTHSHALDLALTEAAMRHPAPAYVGLIGSETKRARFTSRLRMAGVPDASIAGLHCPIGISGLRDKHPASIAASVAADLLVRREALAAKASTAGLQAVG